MSLLEKLKSLFGFGDGRDTSADSTGSITTVEREPSAESEHAVKGTGDIEDERKEAEEFEAESEVEAEDEEVEEKPEATEAEADPEEEEANSEAAETEGDNGAATIEVIDGIGPTYADRLAGAGIETVADLAAADPETVADAAEAGEGRAENWIEQATGR